MGEVAQDVVAERKVEKVTSICLVNSRYEAFAKQTTAPLLLVDLLDLCAAPSFSSF